MTVGDLVTRSGGPSVGGRSCNRWQFKVLLGRYHFFFFSRRALLVARL